MQDGGIRAALRHLRTLAAVRAAATVSDGELIGRFAERHDEAAFTTLVERHGPMVLGVCRRVLGDAHDAEDACQATFLVLVRKAASVRRRGSAASWLYGVAARTARKLRASRTRQDRRDGCRAEAVPDTVADDLSWGEARAVLDEELLRLPEKYRAPLVLCYLEGLTRDEAARRLGLSLTRLRGRLDYGRGLLRARLTRRGLTLPAALLAGLLVREASASVPALRVVSTVKAAALTAAGRALPTGLVPARVLTLTEGTVRTMSLTNLKTTFATLLLAVGLGVGASAVLQAEPGAPAAEAMAKQNAPTPVKPPEENWADRALKGLTKHYALREGEILQSFRPPHPEARKEFFRVTRPPDDKTEWDGNLDLFWNNGRLEFGSVTFGVPARGQGVEGLLRALAGIVPEEVEGDRGLRWNSLVAGDFVVRRGVTAAKVVARLEEILNQEFNLPITLTLRQADRTVYVLEGKYQFTPAAPGQAKDHIELYARELIPDLAPPPGRPAPGATFPEFVNQLGRFVDRRVVLGKAEGLPAKVTWHENEVGPEAWEAAHAAGPVLKRVTEQTGLTVRQETHRVRVLTVERKKTPQPPVPADDANLAKPLAGIGPAWRDDPLYRASQALVAWWPAEGHAFDLAGPYHYRGGTARFAKGRCGLGFSFPDGKGAVQVGGPDALVNTFTLAVWVHPAAPRVLKPEGLDGYEGISGQRYAVFPSHGGDGTGRAGCGISAGTNGIGVFEHTRNYCPCVLADDRPVKGWAHVAVVYAEGRPTLYVNGAAVKTGARSPFAVFPGTFFGDPGTEYGPYQGQLDEPMVFDRALSAAEIAAVIRATRSDKGPAQAGAALSDAAFSELWSYLTGEKAPRSLFAIDRLAAGGDAAVRRLRPLVKPVPVPDQPSVEELLVQLDDNTFKTREQATHLLLQRGRSAVSKLRAHLKDRPSLEVRARVERILRQLEAIPPSPEELRVLRAVTVLSRVDTPSSRALLAEVAAGTELAPPRLGWRPKEVVLRCRNLTHGPRRVVPSVTRPTAGDWWASLHSAPPYGVFGQVFEKGKVISKPLPVGSASRRFSAFGPAGRRSHRS
jgi:RNA polymerase sigma factor (sigma-70 family)